MTVRPETVPDFVRARLERDGVSLEDWLASPWDAADRAKLARLKERALRIEQKLRRDRR